MDENLGVHDAILNPQPLWIPCDSLINIADPYDGFSRNLPSSIFILPVIAELGLSIVHTESFLLGLSMDAHITN